MPGLTRVIAARASEGRVLPVQTVARWIDALGTPRLAEELLAGLQPLLPLAHCFIYLMPDSGAARIVSGATVQGPAVRRTAEGYLAQGFDRFDVNAGLMRRRRRRDLPRTWLTLQTDADIADAAYRKACYTDVGVHSRASVLVSVPGAGHAAVNVYRTLAMPHFAPVELDLLAGCAPVLGALVGRHLQLASAATGERTRDAVLAPLSRRERQVVDGLLQGQTTKMLARAMTVSTHTVNTYRYRAFHRLGIRREKELWPLLGG